MNICFTGLLLLTVCLVMAVAFSYASVSMILVESQDSLR